MDWIPPDLSLILQKSFFFLDINTLVEEMWLKFLPLVQISKIIAEVHELNISRVYAMYEAHVLLHCRFCVNFDKFKLIELFL